jgi:DNA-binding IclR family transcriptional regulator
MRPPASKQDPLRTPLNQIFGSEGNVRVLRVLAFATEPIGRTRVARRAELNPSGVRRTLDRLAELGIVEAIGSGRGQSVRLRERYRLAGRIRFL